MKLVLIKTTNDSLAPATVVNEPDAIGMVALSEPVEVDGQQVAHVPAENCIAFNEDLMLHYNGLVTGGKSALVAADKMLKTYAHPAFDLSDQIPLTH